MGGALQTEEGEAGLRTHNTANSDAWKGKGVNPGHSVPNLTAGEDSFSCGSNSPVQAGTYGGLGGPGTSAAAGAASKGTKALRRVMSAGPSRPGSARAAQHAAAVAEDARRAREEATLLAMVKVLPMTSGAVGDCDALSVSKNAEVTDQASFKKCVCASDCDALSISEVAEVTDQATSQNVCLQVTCCSQCFRGYRGTDQATNQNVCLLVIVLLSLSQRLKRLQIKPSVEKCAC